jgi:thiamine-phosphate pyrophosphorylase
MAERCLLCYITDRQQFSGDETARQQQLLQKISDAARAGVDFVQLREKDLSTRDLEQLAREAVEIVRRERRSLSSVGQGPGTRLLINSRSDVAIAAGADGVHLRSDDISVVDARAIWSAARTRNLKLKTENWIIGVSCHSEADVLQAASQHADFAVFAPIFEKKDAPGSQPAGIEALQKACQHRIRVLALGGVTLENAESCLRAGAAGIAGIRLFQENDVFAVVRSLRKERR